MRKKSALSNLLLKVQRRQMEYMRENQIDPETGKHQTESLELGKDGQIAGVPAMVGVVVEDQLCRERVHYHKAEPEGTAAGEDEDSD